MTTLPRASLAILGGLSVLALSACNGASSSFNPFAPQRGTVRFINASPDAGSVDFAVGKAGVPNFTSVPYVGTGSGGGGSPSGSGGCGTGICAYLPFNSATQNVFIYQAGQDTTPIPVQGGITSINVIAKQRITVVLVGSKANNTLSLITFNETLYTTVSGAASAQFHNAAPSTRGIAWSFGGVNTTTPSLPSSGGVAFSPSLTFPTNTTATVTGISAPLNPAAGIGFYAYPGQPSVGTQPPVGAISLFPSQIEPRNTTNQMPFATGLNSDQNMSLFLIDAPSGASSGPQKLVGVFDPDN